MTMASEDGLVKPSRLSRPIDVTLVVQNLRQLSRQRQAVIRIAAAASWFAFANQNRALKLNNSHKSLKSDQKIAYPRATTTLDAHVRVHGRSDQSAIDFFQRHVQIRRIRSPSLKKLKIF